MMQDWEIHGIIQDGLRELHWRNVPLCDSSRIMREWRSHISQAGIYQFFPSMGRMSEDIQMTAPVPIVVFR